MTVEIERVVFRHLVPNFAAVAPSLIHRSRRRRAFGGPFATATAIAAVMAMPRYGLAGPNGGTVAAGSATISQSGATTTINQSTNNAVINWQGFSVAPSETVNFNQPGAASATLNRVIGNEQSVINGALNANGQVFIVNSAGVLFGKGAQVNVGGLVASTLDISNQDFMAGKYTFSGTSTATVGNQGRLAASQGGYIALLGKTVSNDGAIVAKMGTVAMASGEKITLNFAGNSLIDVTIDQGALNALVENKRAIIADGGKVILTAKAADQILSAQVNNSGLIQARTMSALKGGGSGGPRIAHKGTIKLLAQGGTVNVSGKLDASAPKKGDGGFIETSGDHVKIADSAIITTRSAAGASGTWLIDPTDFNIWAGSAPLTDSGIGVTTLQNNLANGNVSIATVAGGNDSGDININSALTWSSGNSLTLTAAHDINVSGALNWSAGNLMLNAGHDINVNVDPNSITTTTNVSTVNWSAGTLTLNAGANVYVNTIMTATGTANLTVTTGAGTNANGSPMGLYMQPNVLTTSPAFNGAINFSGTGAVTINNRTYTVINDLAGLNSINPAGNYVLGSNISVTPATTVLSGVAGTFTGNFNGFGHSITNGRLNGTGFFDTIGSGATVSNLALATVTVNPATAARPALGILANVNNGNIINTNVRTSTAANALNATNIASAGGLVGVNSGLIQGSSSLVLVNNVTNVAGGLVGTNTASGTILESYSRGVSATTSGVAGTAGTITYAGSFVGVNEGKIDRSYSTNHVNLTGAANDPAVDGVVATVGGFVGWNKSTGTITQSYSALNSNTAMFLSGGHVGGFVGVNDGTITDAYTTSVNSTSTSATWDAGFVYRNTGTITSAYAIDDATGAKQRYGFVFDNTGGTITNGYWSATTDGTAPPLIDTSPATQLNSGTNFASYAGFNPANWGPAASGQPVLRNIPVYFQQSLSSIPTYGIDPTFLIGSTFGLQGGDSIDNLTSFHTQSSYADAGVWKAGNLQPSSVYSDVRGTLVIKPKPLSVIGIVADKTYDGTTSASLISDVPYGGLLGLTGDQTLNVTYTQVAFTDKNVGTAKVVTFVPVVSDGANGGKASNYVVGTTTLASITPLIINPVVTGQNKVYDGTTAATVSVQLPGKPAGDDLSVSYVGAFADKNAGSNKAISVSGITLTGADAGNYMLLATTAQTTATITPRPVTIAGSKAADGSPVIAGSTLTVMNAVGADSVQLGGIAGLASGASGVQPIIHLAGLTLNNPNYTLVGSVGSVVVGGNNLVLGQVESGAATVATAGNVTTVTQTTGKAIIDWQRFSVAANETVNFVQPSASSVILNRVTGNETSVISGALNANGRVFIVNSAGILFQAGSKVNVGALVASTLNVNSSDFNAGNYLFVAAGGNGSVVAKGDIVIVDGGFAALLAPNAVAQTGSLTAQGGKAVLAAATTVTLNLNSATSGLDGDAVANLSGGVSVGGSINLGGSGGILETAGASVAAAPGLVLNTGSNGLWSWTENVITVGDGGDLTGAFLSSQLAARDMTLSARSGDITINGAVSWSSDRTLTLTAAHDININNAITINGANANLVMNYGGDYNILTPASYSGTVLGPDGVPVAQVDPHDPAHGGDGIYGSITFTNSANAHGLTINGQTYTLIYSMSQLDGIDLANGVTGLYFNARTGAYDTPSTPLSAIKSDNVGAFCFAPTCSDPILGTIPMTQVRDGTTYYWNFETRAYDLTAPYSGPVRLYYWDVATGLYDLPSYKAGMYYDPLTGGYTSTTSDPNIRYYYFDPQTLKYDIFSYQASSGKFYDPVAGAYTSATQLVPSTIYFNPATGYYDYSLKAPYTATGNYALAQNLDASGVTYSGAVVTNFNGVFTGLGHTINGLKINVPTPAASQGTSVVSPNAGLFGTVGVPTTGSGASELRDVGLVNVNVNINGNNFAGTLAGVMTTGDIRNVYATGSVTGNNTLGGLVGSVDVPSALSGQVQKTTLTTISNSFTDVTVTSSSATGGGGLGGLVGTGASLSIENSHALGDVKNGSAYVGGLYGGEVQGYNIYIKNSYAAGQVIGGDNTGGLVGSIGGALGANPPGFIYNSFASGYVEGSGQVGGLIGQLALLQGDVGFTIFNSYATGNVASRYDGSAVSYADGAAKGVGGLIGYIQANSIRQHVSVNYSFATGDVKFLHANGENIGGLIGQTDCCIYVNHSYATGDVTGSTTGGGVGGLIGNFGSAISTAPIATYISNSYATGNVTGNTAVGGLVGINGSNLIINSYATGNVTANGIAGGLVGENLSGAIIAGSYATGKVTTTASNGFAGGVVGLNQSVVLDSYFTGVVSGVSGASLGGISGAAGGTILNSYFDATANPGLPLGRTRGANPNVPAPITTIRDSRGLQGSDVRDIAAFANGTIGRIQAARAAQAAAAAARLAAAQAASQVGSRTATATTEKAAGSASNGAMSGAGTRAATDPTAGSIRSNLDAIENGVRADDERIRRRAVTVANNQGAGSRRPGLGATIRRIEINGRRIQAPDGNAPANSTPENPR